MITSGTSIDDEYWEMARAVASGDISYVDPCRYVKEIRLWIEREELNVHTRVCI